MRRSILRILSLPVILPLATLSQAQDERSSRFQTVNVQPGDTLWGIANRYLKDPRRWDELVKHNKQLASDPTVALPGAALKVPVELMKPALRSALLTYIETEVSHKPSGRSEWKEAKLNMPLYPGDSIKTGEMSRGRIKFPHGSVLNLDSHSLVVVSPAGSSQPDLQLVKGQLRARHLQLQAQSTTIVPKTEDATYEATIQDGLAVNVQVFEGSIDVAAQGAVVAVTKGYELQVPEGLAPRAPERMAEETVAAEKIEALRRARSEIAAPAATTDLGRFEVDIMSLRTGVALAGIRVQASKTPDFNEILFDRIIEPDERLSLRRSGLDSGVYWWRIAPIDLLGALGSFSRPKRAAIE